MAAPWTRNNGTVRANPVTIGEEGGGTNLFKLSVAANQWGRKGAEQFDKSIRTDYSSCPIQEQAPGGRRDAARSSMTGGTRPRLPAAEQGWPRQTVHQASEPLALKSIPRGAALEKGRYCEGAAARSPPTVAARGNDDTDQLPP